MTRLRQPPIRPHQRFAGLVNGKHENAVIYVICPGPAGPGRTGPPTGNQTVAVVRGHEGDGNTGSFGRTIWAEFHDDPSQVVRFTRYRTPEAIPTTLKLPCQGTSTVTFTTCFGTLPCASDARDDIVTVSLVNIAV